MATCLHEFGEDAVYYRCELKEGHEGTHKVFLDATQYPRIAGRQLIKRMTGILEWEETLTELE